MAECDAADIALRVHVWPEGDKEALWYASLKRIEGPTRARQGCVSAAVYRSGHESTELVLIERWESREAMEAHLRSADFRVVLSAMDASTREPVFRVDTISSSKGFEYVAGILAAMER